MAFSSMARAWALASNLLVERRGFAIGFDSEVLVENPSATLELCHGGVWPSLCRKQLHQTTMEMLLEGIEMQGKEMFA